jgi:hypothetical protein
MKTIKFVVLVFSLTFLRVNGGFPAPFVTLLSTAWDTINPNSMINNIKDLEKELQNIKLHLEKIEHGVMFGRDMKNIEYLIEQYNEQMLKNDSSAKLTWANLALRVGSDGFQRSMKSLEEMIDGTSQIFAEGSIFSLLAKNKGSACTDIEEASNYLFSLWTLGHATWSQAYNITQNNFEANSKRLQEQAKLKAELFATARDQAFPEYCDCFETGIYYTPLDYFLLVQTGSQQVPTLTRSARACQAECNSDDKCMGFTFVQSSSKCFKHEHMDNDVTSKFPLRLKLSIS